MTSNPTYWDHREGREKPVPDCSAVGAVWDPVSQRCKRVGWLQRLLMNFGHHNLGHQGGQGLGFLFDDSFADVADVGGGFDWGDLFSGGFDFLASAGSSGDGSFWDIFDLALEKGLDEATALAIASGYYGDPAQILQLGDPVAVIATSEPIFLPDSGGLPSVTVPFPTDPFSLPGPNLDVFQDDPLTAIPTSTPLPGYCGRGTYHPQNDPYSCVPFPTDPTQQAKARQRANQQQQANQRRAAQMAQACPNGQARYPYTGKCVPRQCPQGTQRNPATGECRSVSSTQAQANQVKAGQCGPQMVLDTRTGKCVTPGTASSSTGPWLLLLGLGAILVLAESRRR